uniref:Uncharacterized protein n=1 Tax=Panagrolaimus sp. ES5 TaxID=591445 RepID=A0AC34G584_9BILA
MKEKYSKPPTSSSSGYGAPTPLRSSTLGISVAEQFEKFKRGSPRTSAVSLGPSVAEIRKNYETPLRSHPLEDDEGGRHELSNSFNDAHRQSSSKIPIKEVCNSDQSPSNDNEKRIQKEKPSKILTSSSSSTPSKPASRGMNVFQQLESFKRGKTSAPAVVTLGPSIAEIRKTFETPAKLPPHPKDIEGGQRGTQILMSSKSKKKIASTTSSFPTNRITAAEAIALFGPECVRKLGEHSESTSLIPSESDIRVISEAIKRQELQADEGRRSKKVSQKEIDKSSATDSPKEVSVDLLVSSKRPKRRNHNNLEDGSNEDAPTPKRSAPTSTRVKHLTIRDINNDSDLTTLLKDYRDGTNREKPSISYSALVKYFFVEQKIAIAKSSEIKDWLKKIQWFSQKPSQRLHEIISEAFKNKELYQLVGSSTWRYIQSPVEYIEDLPKPKKEDREYDGGNIEYDVIWVNEDCSIFELKGYRFHTVWGRNIRYGRCMDCMNVCHVLRGRENGKHLT